MSTRTRWALLALLSTACVQGPPMAPEDIPPQDTELGVRRDSSEVTIVIPNPFYEPPDTTTG